MAKFQVKSGTGERLFLDDKNEIHRGGEGRIILLPKEKDAVAKVYHPGVFPINEQRFNQLQKLDEELFLKPLDLLYEGANIVGFKMKYAGNDYFPLSTLFNRSFCQRNGISNKFKTNIAKKMIEAVKQAHFNGFVIGDLNQYNVLVSLKEDIKLIDVDSYQTPGHCHTGVLLDEIRDYYYQGAVSMNSDYFALSVLLFYLLTYTHPFKGIHQKYKTLADRMIKQLPVFKDDKLLKVPKCYEPVKDKAIQGKFEKLYMDGERFMFSLNGFSIKTPVQKPLLVKQYDEKDLILKTVLQNTKILDVHFGLNLGYIELTDKFVVFSSQNKSYLIKRIEILKSNYDEIYLGEKNILARKGNKLYQVKNSIEQIKIENFTFSNASFTHQLENILVVVTKGQMYWLYIDEVLNHSIRNKRTEVFSEAMQHHNGLIQNTGGVQRVFYNTEKDLATIKVEKKIKQVFQHGNVGVVQYIENKKLINQYFKINGLQFQLIDDKLTDLLQFGYMRTDNQNGFVFEPDDNKLTIRRTEDFKIISEMQCGKISRLSNLFYTNAGIVIWEGSEVFLANKKE